MTDADHLAREANKVERTKLIAELKARLDAKQTLLCPEPPFVWPEPRVLSGVSAYEQEPPFQQVALESDWVFGLITALAGESVDVIDSWAKERPGFKARLLVTVYPTCLTRQEDLIRLLDLMARYPDQFRIRIKPYQAVFDRPTTALCFQNRGTDLVHILTGSDQSLELGKSHAGQVNFVFRADPALVDSFARYFDWAWSNAADLAGDDVTRIPHLALPEGDENAAQLWQAYLAACGRAAMVEGAPSEQVAVDPQTGDVTVRLQGEKRPTPTEELGVPKLDALAQTLLRLYGKGMLVSIDKASRIPPLDAPIDPKLFGDASELHRGGVTRTVNLRVSIIDEKALREINNCRKALSPLLSKFSYGLADGLRWMPHAARALFEAELARTNARGQTLIAKLLNNDVDAFIKGKQDALLKDINTMYAALGRQGQVEQGDVNRVSDSLRGRLTKAQSARFVPRLTYSAVSFMVSTDNEWASPWEQGCALLHDIATFPRKVLTDAAFFLRGLDVDQDELLQAMNVANDALFRADLRRSLKQRCRDDLDLLKEISDSTRDAKSKCGLILRVLRGAPVDDIRASLVSMPVVDHH